MDMTAADPKVIDGAAAYIVGTYTRGEIVASSPRKARLTYMAESPLVHKAWTEDEWIEAWCHALVHVVALRAGEPT
jgi:hypothetical protein